MTPFQPLLIAAACAFALSACASAPSAPKTEVPLPSATAGADTSAAAGATPYGAAYAGGTYPYGADQKADTGVAQQANVQSSEEIIVMGPDGTVWIRSGAADTRYQSDVDSCYTFAQARVDHDERIESDVSAAFQTEAGGLGLASLRGRMNNFERSRRRPSLFNSCMVAKGYSRQ